VIEAVKVILNCRLPYRGRILALMAMGMGRDEWRRIMRRLGEGDEE